MLFYVVFAGHVMQIDKKGGPSVFSKAILEFPVDSIMALGCSIRYFFTFKMKNCP